VESLVYDLRLAVRNLSRHRAVTSLVVATLAIAIACTTGMFSVLRAVLLRPLPWPDSERLAMIWNVPPRAGDRLQLSVAELRDLDELLADVEVGSYSREATPVRLGERVETWDVCWVTAPVFAMLGARVALGRPFAPDEYGPSGPATVILSHETWRDAFGSDPQVVGKRLVLEGRSHEIVGVMPADVPLPLDYREGDRTQLWAGTGLGWAERWPRETRMFPALARIGEGTTFEHARSQLEHAFEELRRRHPETYPAGWRMELVPVADELFGELRPTLWALFGAVFFVLLIACANVAHLLLAQNDARRHELAIKGALGARRGRLVRQLMFESLLLALAGGAAGALGAYGAVAALLALRPGNLPRIDAAAVDSTVLLFALAASLATAFLFGLLPAVRASGARAGTSLPRGRGVAGGLRPRGIRRLLLVGEVALATVLLAGAGLMVQTLRNLARADLGFEPEGLVALAVSLPRGAYEEGAARVRLWERLREGAAELPAVESASLTTLVPFWSGLMSRPMELERPAGEPATVPQVHVDRAAAGIAGTMGLRLLAGRDLAESDREEGEPVALVNETLARRLAADASLGVGRAVGRRLRFEGRPWLTVVGVVGDNLQVTVDTPPAPRVFVPFAQVPVAGGWPVSSFAWLAARVEGDPAAQIAALRESIRSTDPEITVGAELSLADLVAASALAPYRFAGFVLGLFAAVALLLAVVGVYGLMSYLVRLGRQEVGVRMALGALRGQIHAQVLRQGLALAAGGLVLGLPAAFVTTRLLESVLYGVSPADATAFAVSGLLLAGVAAVASAVPARRATEVSPVEVLRSE
jgi:predicted permease